MTVIWLLPIVLPLLLALALVVSGPIRQAARGIAPWAAAPAFVMALAPEPPPGVTLSWLVLGTELGLDDVGRIFLFLTALLWLAAGIHARSYTATDPKRHRFFVYYLLAMAGNLGMTMARDAASFYLLFALMTFAAYGLVVHPGHAEARRAGRVYIVMAVVGETMLLLGLVLAVSAAGTLSLAAMPLAVAEAPTRDLIIGLLVGGFGIKVGAIPLHVWLPLAHPVAPTPASAVLSGSMIKAGLLGWLRFLPLGEVALPGWGGLLIAAGIGAAFFGVLIGVTQTNPKTALAYSSISQMGIINVGVGVALAEPRTLPVALGAVLAYALHHGLAKGSLFLATAAAPALLAGPGLVMRVVAAAGVLLPMAALAGLPLTSGTIVKHALKSVVAEAPGPWPGWLEQLLPLAAVGTTLLMVRFALLLWRSAGEEEQGGRAHRGQSLPWLALVAGVLVAAWIVPGYYGVQVYDAELWSVSNLWLSSWPVLIGLSLALAAVTVARRAGISLPLIAPGDLLVPAERSAERLPAPHPERLPEPHDPVARLGARWYGLFAQDDERRRLARAERALTRWETAGLVLLAGLVASVVLLWTA
jgi:formate hydrogenlyase subunit 3/multisubunit Na+/H+ antiporter MnhD subunit